MGPSQRPPDPVELMILGAGVSFPEHLSIETIDAIAYCAVVCTNQPEKHLEGLPQNLRLKCRSLWHLYVDGRHRGENYKDVVAEVLRLGEDARQIGWLTTGHPMIFDSVSSNLIAKARERGWHVSVLPAISSLDTILAEVEYDPAAGLFIHEATVVVSRKIPIPPDVAVMLLQPSAFNSVVAKLTLDSDAPDLAPLRDYLLQFYDGAQPCAFVCSASRFTGPARLVWTSIAGIVTASYSDIVGSTMYIPRYRQPRL